MNREEKKLYLKQQCDLIMGAKIIDLETRIRGERAFLDAIKVKQINGDIFVIHPRDIVQILWGVK